MSTRITSQEDKVCLYDSVTGMAFGPVFDSEPECEAFCIWFKETTNFLPSPDTVMWAEHWVRWEAHLEEMLKFEADRERWTDV